MLNLVTYDIDDRELLEKSYESISNKENLEIITGEKERNKVFRKMIDVIRKPNQAEFSLQNLFKVGNNNSCFYIAQCLVDFGYPTGPKGGHSLSNKYYYQLIGIAYMSVDLGITHMRRETKIDKTLGIFFSGDIDIKGAEKFNDKYYLISDKRDAVIKYFDTSFLQTLAKYDSLLLTTDGHQMYISFESDLEVNQSRIVQDIFTHFKHLEQLV